MYFLILQHLNFKNYLYRLISNLTFLWSEKIIYDIFWNLLRVVYMPVHGKFKNIYIPCVFETDLVEKLTLTKKL